VTASRYNLWMDPKILESKSRLRKELAALSFTEKIAILEKLRDREKALTAAGVRKKQAPEKARKQELE